ncbi:hypothetical protein MBAV_003862 [Candidatus Magnetobacterium bavaricum]|uniref:Uncharacterized protein n=1 Tax=Candidatus Magnetobacterium bavaricum TaxID=29290 RepID=A0A0F3GPP2_9BACT|nr:hypothetical protein MBAV_003862 [Candidatus Magnetobacterium bavaricum]
MAPQTRAERSVTDTLLDKPSGHDPIIRNQTSSRGLCPTSQKLGRAYALHPRKDKEPNSQMPKESMSATHRPYVVGAGLTEGVDAAIEHVDDPRVGRIDSVGRRRPVVARLHTSKSSPGK